MARQTRQAAQLLPQGSESETSWPSEDNEDQDTNMLMQTHGGASSSKGPSAHPRGSELEPGHPSDVPPTILAVASGRRDRPCIPSMLATPSTPTSTHQRIARTLPGEHSPGREQHAASQPARGSPDHIATTASPTENLSTSRLRKTLQQLQALLRHARSVIDALGGPPQPAQWHEALAGIRNAADAADALGLAVEEGGVATTQEALEALHSTVDEQTDETCQARPGKTQEGNLPLITQQIIERLLRFLEQDVASRLAQAHGLLFSLDDSPLGNTYLARRDGRPAPLAACPGKHDTART